jgi:hypothetical protein
MKPLLLTILLAACAVTAHGQTIKTLGYNTTNGNVVYAGTNPLTFTNNVGFSSGRIEIGSGLGFWDGPDGSYALFFQGDDAVLLNNRWNDDGVRTSLGLGVSNVVTFAGLTNNGDITINQTATNNGLLYIRRTNNEPFLGLANLIASNNTTISNETLFRVGVSEATNKAAQFGFRSTNTNGNGVAVFSVFGYNALAMIGPSARSATNTNGLEADIYSISPTNKVATLIDTNTGATLMHRPVGFVTNASTPSSTNTIVGWIQFYVGTNSVRVPYYQ